jgi:hypothetical protein
MTTQYSLTDELPKDSGGAKLIALIDDSTSQLDFALLRGIGVEPFGSLSQNLAFLGIGTHTVGSALSASDVGVMLMGTYTEAPSGIIPGNAQMLRSDKEGALYTRSASTIMSYSSASVETHLTGSALLHDLHIRLNDVNAGDTVLLEDGDDYKLQFVATAASQHFHETFRSLYFNSSLKHTLSLGTNGTASVTVGYSTY